MEVKQKQLILLRGVYQYNPTNLKTAIKYPDKETQFIYFLYKTENCCDNIEVVEKLLWYIDYISQKDYTYF